MHSRLVGVITPIVLTLLLPAGVQAGGSEQACCDNKAQRHVSSVADPQLSPAPPIRQLAEVWFLRPTLIGKAIVQGHYVIEHDLDRMASGEPCTHVYAFGNRQKPIATFHCTHLERDRVAQNQVVLATMADGMQKLMEFQFAGEYAAHGYPPER